MSKSKARGKAKAKAKAKRSRTRATVSVVADDATVRDAVATALDRAGYTCETFADPQAFLDAAAGWAEGRSGCVVLEDDLRGKTGLDVQDALNADPNARPIIFLVDDGDVPQAVDAMKGGAMEVLTKPVDADALADCTAAAIREDGKRRKRRRRRTELLGRAEELTPREAQVFDKITQGLANKAVAIDFGISERTVEIHRSRVMRKMQARNLVDLVHMRLTLDE